MATLNNILGKTKEVELTDIEKAVKNYFDANEHKKVAEKEHKKYRAEVEKYFKPGDKQDLKKIGISINYSQSTSVYLDQDALLEKVKELGLTDCVKTREYVDEELLSEKILDGTLNPKKLASCNKEKVTSKLLIKRIK